MQEQSLSRRGITRAATVPALNYPGKLIDRKFVTAHLHERTGLEVVDIEIGHIDFLRDVAYIKMTYPLEHGKTVNSIDQITKFK